MKTNDHFSRRGGIAFMVTLFIVSSMLFSCKKHNAPSTPSNVKFSGTFNGQQEVPPVTTSGTGTVTATYDPSNKTLQYTFTWNDLSGPPIAMHFHDGAAGTNGPVVIPISGFPAQISGTVSGTSDPLNDTLVTDLMAGKFYGNIHTQSHPGGEVRAQVTKQ